jgi:hypothetical protein
MQGLEDTRVKALKIDLSGVSEINAHEDEILAEDVCWSCVSLDSEHDLWIDDDGIFRPGVVFATIGRHAHIPLPAYVCGADGERTTDARLSLEDLRTIVRITSAT